MARYERAPVKAPRLSGVALRAFVGAVESKAFGAPLLSKLVSDSGIEQWRETPADGAPMQVPLPLPEIGPVEDPRTVAEKAVALPEVGKGARWSTVARFGAAYREGKTDPVQVTRRLNAQIEQLDQGPAKMGFFISRKSEEALAQAEAAAARWREGRPLSVLDGVPVVVKDEVDMAGFATTLGTSFRNAPASSDATVVARLKAAGAVILGKANMNEVGINPVGLNPHHGACRNPYDRSRITGGSSSGSGAVVAAGLCPVSIGADGGGSIRIPAGLCGVVGLKATFGRISEGGVPALCWNPGHVGPLGATVADVAAAYALIAGPDPRDLNSLRQPGLHLEGLGNASLKGIRLGICWPYFEDADAEVVKHCKAAVNLLVAAGAVVKELPPPDLNTILWSHTVIILTEMASALKASIDEGVERFALDSRTNLAIGRHFKATDYVHAMRHRHQLTREYLALMNDVDVVVTPTTATVAPEIPESTLPAGESNLPVVDGLMRFIRVGNLTGFPALAVPAGHDAATGLPVSLHLLGRPWEEHLLLRLGRVVEAGVERRLPKLHVDVLG